MKENFDYIEHHQGFLGVPDQFVRPVSGFEHMRTLYAYLTTGLWFLGPIFSALFLNTAFWGLACCGAAYVARFAFPGDRTAPWVAALLTLSGQGFLNSVGEISPHLLGYTIGFWVAAYACAHRIWRADSSPIDHYLVHGFLGVLKLGYETAWQAYPFLLLISWYASSRQTKRIISGKTVSFLARCSVFSLGPGAAMILLSRPFGALDTTSYILPMWLGRSPFQVFTTYVKVLADSVMAFGPFVLILALLGVVAAVQVRNRLVLALAGTLSGVFVMTAVLLLPGARGYITFGLAAPLFIVANQGYLSLWQRTSAIRYLAPALLTGCFVWVNAPLLGFKLPLVGFSWGYFGYFYLGHWQAYKIFLLR